MTLGGALRRTTALVAALATALGCTGCGLTDDTAAPETSVRAVDAARVGDVVVVRAGGHRFATRCAGDHGDPSVLLVADAGKSMASSWSSVQGRIGSFARVCAYDRLGVGGSSAAPPAQTFADMATDLRGVVDKVGLEPPVVLVAHGLGGIVAATVVGQDPQLAAGLLLIDAAGPGYAQAVLDRLPAAAGRRGAKERGSWSALRFPADNVEHLDGRRAFVEATRLQPFGAVPLIALTHSIARHRRSTAPRQQADLESAWEEGQSRWLALSADGRLERVDLAGHDIQVDQPDVVVERVRELLQR